MAKERRDGKHYRARAEECRVIAEILSTVELREKMLEIADDYERMANAADQAKDATMQPTYERCDDDVERC